MRIIKSRRLPSDLLDIQNESREDPDIVLIEAAHETT
jgi:hypothetical protein